MSNYTTGEVAKLCGVSVRTVQYYDTRGVLVPSDLTEGGRRLYSEDDLSKMKIICFLRELGFSLDNITKLMREENSNDVIALLLEEQRSELESEIAENRAKLEKLNELCRFAAKNGNFSVESIGDVAHVMENKKNLRKLRTTMLLTGIPVSLLQLGGIILWVLTGAWWLFAAWVVVAIPWGIWVSKYYFDRVAYICPNCHEVFKPRLREAFWANHTPNTRKLVCPKCGKKSFCVETYRYDGKKN